MKRRTFIKQSAAASVAFSIVPSFVLGKDHVPPSDTLYLAAIGVGGRGGGIVREMAATGKVKFVALCDVDGLETSCHQSSSICYIARRFLHGGCTVACWHVGRCAS